MVAGELTKEPRSTGLEGTADQPGSVVTASGRVSVAQMYEPTGPSGPFTTAQLARLDEALTLATRDTGIEFSIYLGELGSDSRVGAESLHDTLGARADDSVLIAVSPGERVVEVITGASAMYRLPDRGAKLAVMSMVASFKEGDLIGGLISGLRMMSDQAGHDPAR
ncbi:DUF5130 domain-containing protein [Prauserella marina]|uniref:Uncharacterized protein n=1 Tax=Prauserella marina TaxID=530584 RepID=A0A222VZ83_9PSEU|nr:DUF5130 family protein [Prauserella marina]ASR39102.1 DUF5130 domain-containing protein [Prauserella marina]PWV85244.1 uncharacterized protein DUF5130 [Prauserella marina]SDC01517.1 protein of unknown function [Prauserella marina]